MNMYFPPITFPRWLVSEAGCSGSAGEWAARYGNRAFVGIGKGSVKRSGLLDRVLESLKENSVDYLLYEGISPEPPLEDVDEGARIARENGCDVFIGIGGGSVLDVLKIIAMLSTNPGKAEEYQLQERNWQNPSAPLIAIPTTAGTGSEATKVSVMTNRRLGVKKAAYSWEMVPSVVLLDGETMLDCPAAVTRETGLDALGQAVEGYLCTGGTPLNAGAALQAITTIRKVLPAALENGKNLEVRQSMLLASFLGGIAIGSGVGLGHELAMAVGSNKGISHGLLVGALTPICLEANLGWADEKIADIGYHFGVGSSPDKAEFAARTVDEFYKFAGLVGQSVRLADFGVEIADIPAILADSKVSTKILTNPRPMDDAQRTVVLEQAIEGRRLDGSLPPVH